MGDDVERGAELEPPPDRGDAIQVDQLSDLAPHRNLGVGAGAAGTIVTVVGSGEQCGSARTVRAEPAHDEPEVSRRHGERQDTRLVVHGAK